MIYTEVSLIPRVIIYPEYLPPYTFVKSMLIIFCDDSLFKATYCIYILPEF